MKYVNLTQDEIRATFQVRGVSRSADAGARAPQRSGHGGSTGIGGKTKCCVTGECPRGRPSTEMETAKSPRSSSSRLSEETRTSRCRALPRAWRSFCLLRVCVPVGLGHFLAKSCGAAGKSGTPHPDPSRILVASPVRNAFESRGSPHDLCCVADASSLRLRCHCGIALILTVRARTRVCIRAR